MNFSVIIPAYNRQATLRQCLTALLAQTHPAHEIIVVDDGSTDGTAEMMARDFPTVRYLWQQNAGPASARNWGIREATGDIIAFTDDDCLPPSDWLERLADGYRRYPEVAGVGGSLLASAEVRMQNLLARYEAYSVRTLHHAEDEEIVDGFACPAGGTNNMAYRAEALRRIGGFDASFPYPAGEDADLKRRLAQAGARFLYVPVTVTHLQPYTWPAFRRQQITRGKGLVYFERKWARLPSRGRVALRLLYGWLRMLARWPAMPERALIAPALEEVRCNVIGQWAALGELCK